jgi:hypothetical protein
MTMSRSGYNDDMDDQWAFICWRGAVKSAIRGKRGQAFLLEMYRAIDALPERKLIANELEAEGAVCAIGAVGKARGLDMTKIDPHDPETVAGKFGIPDALAREIVFENDEGLRSETPEQRYERMKKWIAANLRPVEDEPLAQTGGPLQRHNGG